jgi:rfaE bifunctional protein nucleotidyltransferase chain/domain
MLDVDSIDEYVSDKIVSNQKAKKIIDELKHKKKTVGLCHGGYDLLHPGHIKHLQSAKKLCDVLFVSVTSDRFVTERKGIGRPIFDENLRAFSLAALESVDYVIISNYKRATDVIVQLKPSFYIKGPDFINKKTKGITEERKVIRDVGGTIKYTRDPTLSTTKIIDYIIKNVNRDKILLIVDRDGTLIEEKEFLGKKNNWKEHIKLNADVIDFLSYIQTKKNAILMIVTNQTGVARGYFNCRQVEEINSYINMLLNKNHITVHNWQYCPDADQAYAEKMRTIKFKKDFVKIKTKRKPCPDMVYDGLNELKMKINDFQGIIVIGDREEDEGLAKNLHAYYIDIKRKKYTQLISEFKDRC